MITVRGTQQPAGDVSPAKAEASAGVPDTLQAQTAEEFADVTAGRMPSIRTIREGSTWDSHVLSWCARLSPR